MQKMVKNFITYNELIGGLSNYFWVCKFTKCSRGTINLNKSMSEIQLT